MCDILERWTLSPKLSVPKGSLSILQYRSYLSIYCNYEELKKVMYDMI